MKPKTFVITFTLTFYSLLVFLLVGIYLDFTCNLLNNVNFHYAQLIAIEMIVALDRTGLIVISKPLRILLLVITE